MLEIERGSTRTHYSNPRSQQASGPAARLLRSWVRIPPGAWIFVCCECCVLSGRGLCDELITHPEESYRLWCVVVCDLETSRTKRPWPALGRSVTKKNHDFIRVLIPLLWKMVQNFNAFYCLLLCCMQHANPKYSLVKLFSILCNDRFNHVSKPATEMHAIIYNPYITSKSMKYILTFKI